MKDLIVEPSDTKFTIYRHKDINSKTKLNLKYPIYKEDTIETILNKIAVSVNDRINSSHIFAFINYPQYDNEDIRDLEKKIIPNDKFRNFIKENFPDFKKLNKYKTFLKNNKEYLNSGKDFPRKGNWNVWFPGRQKLYVEALDKLEKKEIESETFKKY